METKTRSMATPDPTRSTLPAVEVRDLTRSYDGRTVLDRVSFTVGKGEIFALLGPKGAGKSTTVESIAGLHTPDAGTVRVFGYDPGTDRAKVRRLLGVQLHETSFQGEQTVREIVDAYRLLHLAPLDSGELLERLGLDRTAGTHYVDLSVAQQRRLSIGIALVGQPHVIVLDAPTTGLDPAARCEIWDLVDDLRDRDVTVLLATRVTAEAERLADRVALIDCGRLVAVDTPNGLVRGAGLEQHLRLSTTADLDEDWIRRLPEVSRVARDGNQFEVTGEHRMLFSVVSLLAAHDIVPSRLQVDQPALWDASVALTGWTLTPDDAAQPGR